MVRITRAGRHLKARYTAERLAESKAHDTRIIEDKFRMATQIMGKQALQIDSLREQVIHDSKTGLLNHDGIEASFNDLVERAKAGKVTGPLSILFIDLDEFGPWNKEHGQATGDLVLRLFANAFSRVLYRTDRIGRIGGDEYVALLPDTDSEKAQLVAEKLRLLPHQDESLLTLPRTVTMSIGVETLYDLGSSNISFEEAYSPGDLAMQQAKQAGKDRIFVVS